MEFICGTKEPSIEEKNEINKQLSLYKIQTNKSTSSTTPILIPVCIYIKSDPISDTELDLFFKSLNDYYNGIDINYDANKNFFNKYTYIGNNEILFNNIKTQYNAFYTKTDNISVFFYKKSLIIENKLIFTDININNIDVLNNIIKQKTVNSTIVYDVPEINYGKTLNIWFVNFDLLGYAQSPWNLQYFPHYDGVVINSKSIISNKSYINYRLNKTVVHEIGHWLGLYHIFDYDDFIDDTPSQNAYTSGNPLAELVPTLWPTTNSNLSMFINYMDYAYDICSCMFTKDQCARMNMCLNIYRPELKNYIPLSNPNINTLIPNNNSIYYFNDKSIVTITHNFTNMNNDLPYTIKLLNNNIIVQDNLYTISNNIITLNAINTNTGIFKLQIQDNFSTVYSNELTLQYIDNYIPLTNYTLSITISIQNFKKVGSIYCINNTSIIKIKNTFINMNGNLPYTITLLKNNVKASNTLYTISNNIITLRPINTNTGTFHLKIQDIFSTIYSNKLTIKYIDIPTISNIKLVNGILTGIVTNTSNKLVTVTISIQKKIYTIKTYKNIKCNVLTAKLIKKKKYTFIIKTNNTIFTASKSIILTY